MENHLISTLQRIKAFVFDIDGVLTNGQVLITENGEMLRQSNIKDGFAIQHALKKGYEICIISGGLGNGYSQRLQRLGVENIYVGQADKMEAFKDFRIKQVLNKSEILYMGDDIPDIQLFDQVAFSCCPSDAVQDVLEKALYVSPIKGGFGCVRDIIEKTMKIQGTW